MALVLAFAIATTLAACGSSTSSTSSSSSTSAKVNLNTPHIERAIELSILSQRHVHAKVVCPKVVPQKKGHDFTCVATVDKNTTPFAVVQQNNSGYVTYQAK
jgi:ABC-type Fe3+-hydroxamate transport system substrate-binding protein